MDNFVLLSDGNNVVIKTSDQSYKFTGCFMTSVNMNQDMGIDMSMSPRINVSIDLVADSCESGDEIDLSGYEKICKLLECAEVELGDFGQIKSRNLDI